MLFPLPVPLDLEAWEVDGYVLALPNMRGGGRHGGPTVEEACRWMSHWNLSIISVPKSPSSSSSKIKAWRRAPGLAVPSARGLRHQSRLLEAVPSPSLDRFVEPRVG